MLVFCSSLTRRAQASTFFALMKHNNAIPRAHFRKEWEQRVRTWFNQPARKERRRKARAAKAAAIFPRPTGKLAPLVQAPTKKYNTKTRLGRGFTVEEIKGAGLLVPFARSVGIKVDIRRKNRSEEGLQRNVARLRDYIGKLVLFPRKADKPKKGDATAEQVAAVQQPGKRFTGDINRIVKVASPIVFRAVTEAEKHASAFQRLRRERSWPKVLGALPKYQARLAESIKAKKEKENKADAK
jgi:large subunit ribosomal protein L13e